MNKADKILRRMEIDKVNLEHSINNYPLTTEELIGLRGELRYLNNLLSAIELEMI